MTKASHAHPLAGGAFLRTVPHAPGVYLMKTAQGEVLYVGKAKDLRKRVASYRRALGNSRSKTGVMLAKTARIDTIITATEKEALILESNLIKKHRPRYNVMLRDDKSYPYIKITVQEKWPRLVVTRRKANDRARYFGPFSSTSAMWQTIKVLNRIFPLRRCKGANLKKRQRPCLNFQMGKCMAPCAGKVSPEEYAALVAGVTLALSRPRKLIADFTRKMNDCARALEFEQAAQYRDKIDALEKTTEKQVVSAGHHRHQDAFGFARVDGAVAVSVLQVRSGLLESHRGYFLPDALDDDASVLAEALSRFYGDTTFFPHEILVPFLPEGADALAEWFKESASHGVTLKRPRRGASVRLLAMAESNARQVFRDREKKARSWRQISAGLMKALALRREPERITCLDISNTGGELSVGSVVSFHQGEKETARYRHYSIKTVEGPDDYASMREVLSRHLVRAAEGGFMPDLLLMDGGKGQLNIAVSVLTEMGLADDIDLAGIAKEKGEEGEKLYRPGRKNPIILQRHSPVLLLLMRIRDEAHRYGITFHRRKRGRKSLASPLDDIPGIGPARKRMLLRKFGSLKRLKKATVEELTALPGIGGELASVIRERLGAC